MLIGAFFTHEYSPESAALFNPSIVPHPDQSGVPRERWRARLLPRSLRWYVSRCSSEASDLLDQFDLALSRLRYLVIPRRSA